jgi:hypothetical protein
MKKERFSLAWLWSEVAFDILKKKKKKKIEIVE